MHHRERSTPSPEEPSRTAADLMPALQEDLQQIADTVPPHQYGYVTAREFAIGKYSAKRGRRRYALT